MEQPRSGAGRTGSARATRWVADSARQIDYWVTAGAPAQVLGRYADVTGHAPVLPGWAAGLWQSKLRYRTQDELLDVAREYRRRDLPLSVIVVDFFHWTQLGDWRFEPSEWPDPRAMVEELSAMGVHLMVSVWPSVSVMSSNYRPMLEAGYLIIDRAGPWGPCGLAGPARAGKAPSLPSMTPPTRRPVRMCGNRYAPTTTASGSRSSGLTLANRRSSPATWTTCGWPSGRAEVLNRYPADHARAFYEGMHAAGETDVVNLVRSAWAGSQHWGAALWSGDINATFESLAGQVRAGLNVALSGIPWWTTDIGGFHGGDPTSPEYRELMVRWFQYGAWCPLFRLHGNRAPQQPLGHKMTGGPNEVWSYGDEAYEILAGVVRQRERAKPYILEQMATASSTGVPPMRPIWFDFPDDNAAWAVDDEFCFGPSVLVAPVTELGARSRKVYVPAGADWTDPWTEEVIAGGTWLEAAAPLERIPLYLRDGAQLPVR